MYLDDVKFMTLEEALDTMEPEICVYDDIHDVEHPTWCGNRLTAYGKEVYKDLLQLKVRLHHDYMEIQFGNIGLNDEQIDEMESDIDRMFYDMAGYCSADEYDKRFYEED